jgi:hypothetical protein
MVPACPYGPALCSKVQLQLQEKIVNVAMRSAITWRMKNVTSFFSENKYSTCNEKNSGDSSYQVLTNFSFSEFLTSDFRQNKFLKFLMANMAKFREVIVTKIRDQKF